eukprot:31303-Pelagococcus_subviridis.AAC.24
MATTSGPRTRTQSPVPSSPGRNMRIMWYCSAVAASSNECPALIIATGAADMTTNIAAHDTATQARPFLAEKDERKSCFRGVGGSGGSSSSYVGGGSSSSSPSTETPLALFAAAGPSSRSGSVNITNAADVLDAFASSGPTNAAIVPPAIPTDSARGCDAGTTAAAATNRSCCDAQFATPKSAIPRKYGTLAVLRKKSTVARSAPATPSAPETATTTRRPRVVASRASGRETTLRVANSSASDAVPRPRTPVRAIVATTRVDTMIPNPLVAAACASDAKTTSCQSRGTDRDATRARFAASRVVVTEPPRAVALAAVAIALALAAPAASSTRDAFVIDASRPAKRARQPVMTRRGLRLEDAAAAKRASASIL